LRTRTTPTGQPRAAGPRHDPGGATEFVPASGASLSRIARRGRRCQMIADKPVADKPVADKPVADKPVADKP
jgi:hypothetical protein